MASDLSLKKGIFFNEMWNIFVIWLFEYYMVCSDAIIAEHLPSPIRILV